MTPPPPCRDADYRADRGAFFKSLHGTLNHLLVGDRIWMRRFTGDGRTAAKSRRHSLRRLRGLARRAPRRRRTHQPLYRRRLSESDLAGTIRYRTVRASRQTIEQTLAPALDHFFNHQTHHRGQAHALLSAVIGNDAHAQLRPDHLSARDRQACADRLNPAVIPGPARRTRNQNTFELHLIRIALARPE